jgi:hypothetical protein
VKANFNFIEFLEKFVLKKVDQNCDTLPFYQCYGMQTARGFDDLRTTPNHQDLSVASVIDVIAVLKILQRKNTTFPVRNDVQKLSSSVHF